MQKETVLAGWRHWEQIGEARSNEPVALYAGVWQLVVMVGRNAKAWTRGAGVWRAVGVALWVALLLSITRSGGLFKL